MNLPRACPRCGCKSYTMTQNYKCKVLRYYDGDTRKWIFVKLTDKVEGKTGKLCCSNCNLVIAPRFRLERNERKTKGKET